jgi:HEAT repeat protein
MNTPQQESRTPRLVGAMSAPNPSVRLQAALAAGTHPDPEMVGVLIDRCAVEPDFFVRDMLTWALIRHPEAVTAPRLLTQLHAETAQARSQALHTLSKIRDPGLWPKIPKSLLHDPDDQVARTAWRALVGLVPAGSEGDLAGELVTELGRGDRDIQRSLSRALITLGEVITPLIQTAVASSDPAVRAHAEATERLRLDPDSEFTISVADAKRIINAGNAVRGDS